MRLKNIQISSGVNQVAVFWMSSAVVSCRRCLHMMMLFESCLGDNRVTAQTNVFRVWPQCAGYTFYPRSDHFNPSTNDDTIEQMPAASEVFEFWKRCNQLSNCRSFNTEVRILAVLCMLKE